MTTGRWMGSQAGAEIPDGTVQEVRTGKESVERLGDGEGTVMRRLAVGGPSQQSQQVQRLEGAMTSACASVRKIREAVWLVERERKGKK